MDMKLMSSGLSGGKIIVEWFVKNGFVCRWQ
jgi:hypothetical protein